MSEAQTDWKLVADELAVTLKNLLAGADELDRCANPELWSKAEEQLEKHYGWAVSNNDNQEQAREEHARLFWMSGERPSYSTGLDGELTCGYGRLDHYGYWQYPLYPAEQYLEQGEFKNVSL